MKSPRLRFDMDTANEVDQVADVVLRQPIVDPGRHGRALDAVENRFEQPPVAHAGHERRIAQIARPGQDVERVRTLAIRLAPVTAGAALDEGDFTARGRFGTRGYWI